MQRRLSAVPCLVTALLISGVLSEVARADVFYTGLATVLADKKPNDSTVIGHPDVQVIMFQGNNSRAFTNTYGVDSLGRSLIRTVAVTTLQLYDQKGGGNVTPIHYEGNDLITAVTVLEGYVESVDTVNETQTALFTFGRVGLFTVAKQADFKPLDPSTWGIVKSSASGDPESINEAIATYVLKPPEDIRDGLVSGFPLLTDINGNPFVADVVNRSSISTAQNGKADGNLLYKEESGIDFITVTDPVVPPGLANAEGFFVQYRQSINSAETGKVSQDDLDFLNFIASNFGGRSDLGGAGTGFASALETGNGTNYFNLPTYAGTAKNADQSNVFFGDFVAAYDTVPSNKGELRGVRPGVETTGVIPVPEPSTGALASIGLMLTGFAAWRRRRVAA